MAISSKKGKFIFVFTISLLFSDFIFVPRFSFLVLASPHESSDPSPHSTSIIETDANPFEEKSPNQNPDAVLLKKHQLQLEIFQELVQNLTHLIARLESHFTDTPEKLKSPPLSPSQIELIEDDKIKVNESKEQLSAPEGEDSVKQGPISGSTLVTKYNSFWSERFQFVSAVKLSSKPTCVNVLPYKDFEGMSKYFAVGDDNGKLYIFLRSGDISLEFSTFLEPSDSSPITAIVSYLSLYKNESTIVTGHENGAIVMHRVWETMPNGDEWSSLHFERVGGVETPNEPSGSRIDLLEVHHVGRKKYVLATDNVGKITVFKENGAFHGSATPTRKPVAFLKQRLLFLTENGAGSLDLRTMKLKETECDGLNGSFAKNYVFDTTDKSKAYGFTSDGDLIHTLLLGDVMNFKCRVRSKRKLDLDEPMALQAIKGYLLIANKEKVLVYNVSSQHYVRVGGLRLLFSAGLDEIIASFLNQQVVDVNIEKGVSMPLITSDYEKHVIISLGNGYVAMYRSNLPVFKNEFGSILWTSPVLFFILFLFGAWHFFANKKEALTSWGPDDPFSGGGGSSGLVTGGAEASRSSEIMEMRAGGGGGGGLRGTSSRYVSPPRYSGGAANSYRAVGTEAETRASAGDARFRTTSELKKRREGIFVNSQVVDDGN